MLWSRRSWILVGWSQCGMCLPQDKGTDDKNDDEINEDTYELTDVTSPPRPIHTVKPSYTDRARRGAIRGTVTLQFVINSEGVPKQIRISKSLDAELDQASIESLKLWRFSPARKNDKPVAVRASIEFTFGVV